MIHYCKKCGRIIQNSYNKEKHMCDCCNSLTYPVPEKYWLDGLDFLISDNAEKELINELVKTSPEFDQDLFDNRDEILANKHAAYEAEMAIGRAYAEGRDKGNKFGISCPYCKATNVKKISVTSKVASTAVWGIFAMGKVSKQWHCNHCKSDF